MKKVKENVKIDEVGMLRNQLARVLADYDNLRKRIEAEKEVWEKVRSQFMTEHHISGSIGKRYRRQDEIGTPFCVTVDFETLKDNAVTVRERDSMKQERVKIEELVDYLKEKFEE